LTINEPTESGCGGGNVTISPDKTYTIVGKDSRQFLYKRGTVVTLTINTRPGFALYIHPWEGPDAASVVTVTANVTYTITITKDMNITVAWYVYCT
jgi:hypothetical protein